MDGSDLVYASDRVGSSFTALCLYINVLRFMNIDGENWEFDL